MMRVRDRDVRHDPLTNRGTFVSATPTMTLAAIDRLIHQPTIVEVDVESYAGAPRHSVEWKYSHARRKANRLIHVRSL